MDSGQKITRIFTGFVLSLCLIYVTSDILVAQGIVKKDIQEFPLVVDHNCLDFIDNDGDGECDLTLTCEKHNSEGGCGNHEEPSKNSGITSDQPTAHGCGGCPRAQANGGSCGGLH